MVVGTKSLGQPSTTEDAAGFEQCDVAAAIVRYFQCEHLKVVAFRVNAT